MRENGRLKFCTSFREIGEYFTEKNVQHGLFWGFHFKEGVHPPLSNGLKYRALLPGAELTRPEVSEGDPQKGE